MIQNVRQFNSNYLEKNSLMLFAEKIKELDGKIQIFKKEKIILNESNTKFEKEVI